jgi:hypothetical protein
MNASTAGIIHPKMLNQMGMRKSIRGAFTPAAAYMRRSSAKPKEGAPRHTDKVTDAQTNRVYG